MRIPEKTPQHVANVVPALRLQVLSPVWCDPPSVAPLSQYFAFHGHPVRLKTNSWKPTPPGNRGGYFSTHQFQFQAGREGGTVVGREERDTRNREGSGGREGRYTKEG